MKSFLILTILVFSYVNTQELPNVYEYFTEGGIQSGLTADTPGFFKLNGKDLRIVSGAMHYYRVHPDYWRDRLRKMRAAGLNTVETYIPWNLCEFEKGIFDFGNGDNDMSMFLDVRKYVQMAQEEDLLVIFRPGPYICTEWDFGGLPSWLQRDPNMRVREDYEPYLERVKIYLDNLLPQVADLQFTRGGSIIMLQLENEYGSFDNTDENYVRFIQAVYEDNGMDCLFFTSDGVYNGWKGSYPELFYTANFQGDADGNFDQLYELQPNRPLMSMEFWSGWFDHWFKPHHTTELEYFANTSERIFARNGSVNYYMFHGGTNFGFWAGANVEGNFPYYAADVTSYDYDCPLSEAGDYTLKYYRVMEQIERYAVPKLFRPDLLRESTKRAYGEFHMEQYLTYSDLIDQTSSEYKHSFNGPVSMENLPINGDSGQSQGYIVYRVHVTPNKLKEAALLEASPVRDFAVVLINNRALKTPLVNNMPKYWNGSDLRVEFEVEEPTDSYMIDLFIENTARVNFGHSHNFLQQKGLPYNGSISINNEEVIGVDHIAMEFKSKWVQGLTNWRNIEGELQAPVLLQANFNIAGEPADTFLDMSDWTKGIVFINGFNIGRYFRVGPQQTLYIPAPLLKSGSNNIKIFEQLQVGPSIKFVNRPILNQMQPAPAAAAGMKSDETIRMTNEDVMTFMNDHPSPTNIK